MIYQPQYVAVAHEDKIYTFHTSKYVIPTFKANHYFSPVRYKTVSRDDTTHTIYIPSVKQLQYGGIPIYFLLSDESLNTLEDNTLEIPSSSSIPQLDITIDDSNLTSLRDGRLITTREIFLFQPNLSKQQLHRTNLTISAGKNIAIIKSSDKFFVPLNDVGEIKPHRILGRHAGYVVIAIDSDEDVILAESDEEITRWDLGWQDVSPTANDILNAPTTTEANTPAMLNLWYRYTSGDSHDVNTTFDINKGYFVKSLGSSNIIASYHFAHSQNDTYIAFYNTYSSDRLLFYFEGFLPETNDVRDWKCTDNDTILAVKQNQYGYKISSSQILSATNDVNNNQYGIVFGVNHYTACYVGGTTPGGLLKVFINKDYEILAPIQSYTRQSTSISPKETIQVINPLTNPTATLTNTSISAGKHIVILPNDKYYIPVYEKEGKYLVADYQRIRGWGKQILLIDMPQNGVLAAANKELWQKQLTKKYIPFAINREFDVRHVNFQNFLQIGKLGLLDTMVFWDTNNANSTYSYTNNALTINAGNAAPHLLYLLDNIDKVIVLENATQPVVYGVVYFDDGYNIGVRQYDNYSWYIWDGDSSASYEIFGEYSNTDIIVVHDFSVGISKAFRPDFSVATLNHNRKTIPYAIGIANSKPNTTNQVNTYSIAVVSPEYDILTAQPSLTQNIVAVGAQNANTSEDTVVNITTINLTSNDVVIKTSTSEESYADIVISQPTTHFTSSSDSIVSIAGKTTSQTDNIIRISSHSMMESDITLHIAENTHSDTDMIVKLLLTQLTRNDMLLKTMQVVDVTSDMLMRISQDVLAQSDTFLWFEKAIVSDTDVKLNLTNLTSILTDTLLKTYRDVVAMSDAQLHTTHSITQNTDTNINIGVSVSSQFDTLLSIRKLATILSDVLVKIYDKVSNESDMRISIVSKKHINELTDMLIAFTKTLESNNDIALTISDDIWRINIRNATDIEKQLPNFFAQPMRIINESEWQFKIFNINAQADTGDVVYYGINRIIFFEPQTSKQYVKYIIVQGRNHHITDKLPKIRW